MRLPAFAWFLLGFSFMVVAGLATAADNTNMNLLPTGARGGIGDYASLAT